MLNVLKAQCYLWFLVMPYMALATSADSLMSLAESQLYQDPAAARELLYEAIPQSSELQLEEKSQLYRLIGITYDLQADLDSAESYFLKAVDFAQLSKSKQFLAKAYNSLGVLYFNKEDYPLSLSYYQKTMLMAEEIQDSVLISKCLSNIGHIHFYQNEMEKAFDLYEKALAMAIKISNQEIVSNNYQNIANIYYTFEQYDSAIINYQLSLEIDEKIGNDYRAAYTLVGLAQISEKLGDLEGAMTYYQKSLLIRTSMKDELGQMHVHLNIGKMHIMNGNLSEALESGQLALELAQKLKSYEGIYRAALLISDVQRAMKRFEEATISLQMSMSAKDSLFNETNQQIIKELEKKYESEKQQMTISILEKDKAINEEASEIKSLQIKILSIVIIAFIGLGFAGYKAYSNRKKAAIFYMGEKKAIEEKQEVLEKRSQEVKDGLTYARRIQKSLLPSTAIVKNYLPEHYILYKPKDIVSGDFYWVEKVGKLTYVAVIDCTGHGVPGAMMSVIAHSNINRVLRETQLTDPGKFLDRLNVLIEEEIDSHLSGVQDGMDMTLCIIDTELREIQMAGANHNAFILHNGVFEELKFNRQPVGPYYKREAFVTQSMRLNKGDEIVLFTDGYSDQFGGPEGKKFYYRNFRKLMSETVGKEMMEQKQGLEKTLADWANGYEQLDDILVMGLRV